MGYLNIFLDSLLDEAYAYNLDLLFCWFCLCFFKYTFISSVLLNLLTYGIGFKKHASEGAQPAPPPPPPLNTHRKTAQTGKFIFQ